MLPDNIRELTIRRLPSGDYQANLNTMDRPVTAYAVGIGDTALAALREACRPIRNVPAPPCT